ncbi:MAG: transglycosylase SLT domain-containing protein [Bacteroidales bacterium]|jgi:hypothetical protein|nr:transglycosylase SLT domain-containing protein [Bacteroidales bacterium]
MRKGVIFMLIGMIITLLFFMIQGSEVKNNDEIVQRQVFQQILMPFVPDKVTFCGKEIPLNKYNVRESFERELITNCYLHGSTLQTLKRANRYFSVIEPILRKNNIPEDMKYLAVAESGLRNVVSPAKAEGVWQFLKDTGKEYGLEVTNDVDERYHLEKATQAACDYFKKSYENYKDWALVAAAYNAGNARIKEFIEKQKTEDYYDMLMSQESMRYVYRIAALKCILENPTSYGFYLGDDDIYPIIPVETVKVDTSITSLADFAHQFDISYLILKEFNPWLRNTFLTNKAGKEYEIVIPKKGYTDYDKKLQREKKSGWFIGY